MRNSLSHRRASWREYAQGGVLGGVLFASLVAVADTCIQLDTPPKVADYYEQYQDYRDQYEQLKAWKERVETQGIAALMPEGLQGAVVFMKGRYEQAEALYENAKDLSDAQAGDYAVAAIRQTGELERLPKGALSVLPTDSVRLCYELDMGADIGLMAQTGESNNLAARCGTDGRQALANLSIRPSQDGAGIAPNIMNATDVTRAVAEGGYSLLDVVRGDLAWLRDNPAYWSPFRYPREDMAISLEEAAQHSAALQRVAAIMAGRGFAAQGYSPLKVKDTLASDESRYNAANLLGRLGLVYDGMARYATVYPRIAAMRDRLLNYDTATIDSANQAERYGISLDLSMLESELATLRIESGQREQRLLGLLMTHYIDRSTTELMGGQQ